MKLKMFSVYDTKAQNYNAPFFMAKTPEAIRAFSDLCNDEKTTINKHPEDYILYEVGTFDSDNAGVTQLVPPANLGHASDYIRDNKIIMPEVVK